MYRGIIFQTEPIFEWWGGGVLVGGKMIILPDWVNYLLFSVQCTKVGVENVP